MVQDSPDGLNTSSAWPSWPPNARAIRCYPQPVRFGSTTGGPPFSCQTSFTKSGLECRSQVTPTRPVPFDRAPYFTALVASSCIIIETMTVLAASNQRWGGPSTVMRVPTLSWNGSSALLTAALSEAFSHVSVVNTS